LIYVGKAIPPGGDDDCPNARARTAKKPGDTTRGRAALYSTAYICQPDSLKCYELWSSTVVREFYTTMSWTDSNLKNAFKKACLKSPTLSAALNCSIKGAVQTVVVQNLTSAATKNGLRDLVEHYPSWCYGFYRHMDRNHLNPFRRHLVVEQDLYFSPAKSDYAWDWAFSAGDKPTGLSCSADGWVQFNGQTPEF
jgi:hypothetical protein